MSAANPGIDSPMSCRPGHRAARSTRATTARRNQTRVAPPIERRTRVGLPALRNLAVTGDIDDRVPPAQRTRETREHRVLCGLVADIVGAFQLDADGEIVAVPPAAPRRRAGVPGAPRAGYELGERAVAADHEMRGNAQGR